MINIVFLMLIFFLIAGHLAPPADPEVNLIQSQDSEPTPPPDALYVHADGTLTYRSEPVTPERFVALRNEVTTPETPLRIAADHELSARDLLSVVKELYSAGAQSVRVVTIRPIE